MFKIASKSRNLRVKAAWQNVGRWRSCESGTNQDRKVNRNRRFRKIILYCPFKTYLSGFFAYGFLFTRDPRCLPATRAVCSRSALCTRDPRRLPSFRAVYPQPGTSEDDDGNDCKCKKDWHPLVSIQVQLTVLVTLYAVKPTFDKTSLWRFRSKESQK